MNLHELFACREFWEIAMSEELAGPMHVVGRTGAEPIRLIN